MALSKMES